MAMRRRTLLALFAAGVAAAFVGPPALRRLRAPGLSFEPVPGLPGFRQVAGGRVSGGDRMLIGLDDDPPTASAATVCADLFTTGMSRDRVPIAYFSDARCIHCRVLSPMLHDIEQTDPVRVTWHEFPVLGMTSLRAAEASLAARRQGAYDAFHGRLMGTPFVPNEGYLRQLAADAGIDADRLLEDMSSAAVAGQLQRSAHIARAFGFFGTPALVVGRTAILGTVEKWQLRRLVEAELSVSDPHPCA